MKKEIEKGKLKTNNYMEVRLLRNDFCPYQGVLRES